MKGIHFTIVLTGKSSLLPLCVMAPGCYACVYETQHRARHLGLERGAGNCKHTCCSCSGAYDVYATDTLDQPCHLRSPFGSNTFSSLLYV